MPADTNTPLILLSGLAADGRILTPQKVRFRWLHCPAWLPPDRDESIDEYAKRLADTLDAGPCIIGGASFGGIVALHLARHVDAQAVILIGSIKSPSQLPVYARCARPFRFLIPFIPIRFLQWLTRPMTAKRFKRFAPFAYGLACQFRDSDPRIFRWSLSRILDWSSDPVVSCPIYHLHGDRDWTLPLRYTDPDRIVAGGGHVISLTHPADVNDFIRHVLYHKDVDNPHDGNASQQIR
ncbi:Alpha/beta hydrolase family protein [Rubripirellula lacrimiformis]|uniref:Alpha/beta hydrolase family protein n=1 Tax=Rubripirellula lacrimiformis TaxID=1930273 RepID=A0A517ND77_9BACT|nr:alpha/beta hydrolase [Rubripirellula lacrimiformis]QDT05087.1 Alpha/beta hydrolase family protein [Rubripirellula lacrimiformis]